MARSFFGLFRRKQTSKGAASSEASARRGELDHQLFSEDFLRQMESLTLLFRRARGGARRGELRGHRRGSGLEFIDYRPYAAGDDIRGLDWTLYQRLGKLLVRLYDEPEDVRIYFLIDASASMQQSGVEQWNLARQLVAALAYLGLSQLASVSLVSLREETVERLAPTQGKLKIFRILRFLSTLQPQGKTHLGKSIEQFLRSKPPRGVAFLLSDFLDPHGLLAGIDALRFHRFETVVLQFQTTDEGGLPPGELQLQDCETLDAEVVLLDRQELTSIQARQKQHEQELKSYCIRKQVAHFTIKGTPSLKEVIFSLRARGVVR